MAILTADEVANAMGVVAFEPSDVDLVEMYIAIAIGEIEAYLGRPVERRVFTENVWPDASGAVYFSNTPVHSVSELIVNGQVQDLDFFTLTSYGFENIWSRTYPIASLAFGGVDTDRIYGPQITVTYCAGLDNPMAVKGLILGAVMKKMNSREETSARRSAEALGVRRIEVEDFRVEYERPASGSRSTGASNFSMFESLSDFQVIARLKRRAIG